MERTAFYYDNRGNQTVKQAPEGTTYFQYNHQNLLTRIDLPDATSNEFGYDGDSKRVWVNDSQGARRMIYQGPDMLKLFQEKDVVGQTVAMKSRSWGTSRSRQEAGGGGGDGDRPSRPEGREGGSPLCLGGAGR